MANEEHLSKLREGVTVWNEWRQVHPAIQPDLSEADLHEADLEGADLHEANLRKADLRKAHLRGADFSFANLNGADFSGARISTSESTGANFSRASLWETNLSDADFAVANLSDARLGFANLSGASLYHADLSGATLSRAFFDIRTSLEGVTLSDGGTKSASVVDAIWGGVNLAVVDWEPVKKLGDEYQARLLKLEAYYQTAVRANRQLAVALRDQGLNEQADHFAYRAQVLQRKVLWKQRDLGKWLFSSFLALLTGYGYRMWRILAVYLLVVLLCAVAYFVLGMYYEPHLSFLDAVLTSITAFHGRVFSEPFLRPGEPQLWVTAFEAVMGLVIEGVFIAMLTQKFFGK